jgi:glycosyltransferase involved in cell wall biosynthesis
MRYLFLIRSWYSFEFFDKCIDSVFAQNSTNYTILYIDDGSSYSQQQKNYINEKLKDHYVVFNTNQQFAVKNAYVQLHKYASQLTTELLSQTIIISLDGDDWLYGTNVLEILDKTYTTTNSLFTYGNCLYYQPSSWRHNQKATYIDPTTNRRFPSSVEAKNAYRTHLEFPPLHIKTWRLDAFLKIPQTAFLRPDGSWLQFCEDQAILYPLFEMARGRYTVIEEVLSVYNRSHRWSDDILHVQQMARDEIQIREKYSLKQRRHFSIQPKTQ